MIFPELTEFCRLYLPVALDRPIFCLMVFGMSGLFSWHYFQTRSVAALIASAATLLYLLPFVRFPQ